MWTKKKESDILSQMASDARVSDAAKCEIKPILQPQARRIGVKTEKRRCQDGNPDQRQVKIIHHHNNMKLGEFQW